MDRSKWKVKDYQRELAARGAKISGRKKELEERLEAYERNDNFGATPIISNVSHHHTQAYPQCQIPNTIPLIPYPIISPIHSEPQTGSRRHSPLLMQAHFKYATAS